VVRIVAEPPVAGERAQSAVVRRADCSAEHDVVPLDDGEDGGQADANVERDYRALLKSQFDETPSQISLAGYLGARYVLPILSRIERPVTRDAVLSEFARRAAEDVGGFQIGFSASQRRGSTYVTQTLLTETGRQLG